MAGVINELTSGLYTAQLVDEANVPIQLSDIVTFELTLYDQLTGTIVNGRDKQNVLNANGVTVNATGAVSWDQDPADNVVVNGHLDSELRIALWTVTYGVAGAKEMNHEFSYRVINMSKVP